MNDRLRWLVATVAEIRTENPEVKTLVFDVPGWGGHLAGQHVDIRLTAEDGYVAQRSYSIGSPAGNIKKVELTMERVRGGEVSPFVLDELRMGDTIELRGPIGGYFTWTPGGPDPLMLIGGGSGVVPLMSMLRTRAAASAQGEARLFYSSRSEPRVIYRSELEHLEQRMDGLIVTHTLTREAPEGWKGERGRLGREVLSRLGCPPDQRPDIFVCGPTTFVEAIADHLVAMGHPEVKIRTERFGPSGESK